MTPYRAEIWKLSLNRDPKLREVLAVSRRHGRDALQVMRDVTAVEKFAAPYAVPASKAVKI